VRVRRYFALAILLVTSAIARAANEDLGVDLVKSAPAPVAVGARGSVSLTLLPRAGNRLLDDGPVLVHVDSDGLAVERSLYRREDAVDPRAEAPRFELAFRAVQAGRATLHARITLWICRAQRCRPVESEATFHLDVTP
jgi:hypothetical protein